MSLNIGKLEKVRELANGIIQARCPACTEAGGDRTGEHLRVYPDGRYGCCVHPKDAQHRKRIFALAGDRDRLKPSRDFKVKVAAAKPAEPGQSIRAALAGFRTLRTGNSESVSAVEGANGDSRTLRTPFSNPRAYAKEDSNNTHTYKDSESGVLSVLSENEEERFYGDEL